MKMIQNACAICGSHKNYSIVYKANFSENNLNKEAFSARRLPDGSHYQIVKCNNDGLIRSNPTLKPLKIKKLYKNSELTYKKEINNLEKTYLEALQPVLERINQNDNILEIGCGNGFILKRLYQMGFINCYGIEPSIKAVIKSDRRVKHNIIVDILKPGLFKKKKFKFIFFFQTFDHVLSPGKFLNLCHNLLEKGGYILAFNHNIDSFSSKLLGDKSPIIDIEHTYFYNSETIKKLLEKCYFKPIRIYFPVNIISLKYLVWLLPLPKFIKRKVLLFYLPNISFKIKLGNLCIIAVKN